MQVFFAQSCPTLCDAMDCSLPGSSVHGILQTRILERVAIPSVESFGLFIFFFSSHLPYPIPPLEFGKEDKGPLGMSYPMHKLRDSNPCHCELDLFCDSTILRKAFHHICIRRFSVKGTVLKTQSVKYCLHCVVK